MIDDGVLYHKQAGPTAGVISMQRVVSLKEQTRLVRACHVSIDAGNHYGRDKTLSKVKQGLRVQPDLRNVPDDIFSRTGFYILQVLCVHT